MNKMSVVVASAKTRMSYTNLHMANAHRLAMNIHAIEKSNAGQLLGPFFDNIQNDILPCIMSAGAAAEAYVNEVLFEIKERGPLSTSLVDKMVTLERSVLGRLALPPLIIGKPGPDMSTKLWKRYGLLVQLRNKIIHFSPEWLGREDTGSPHTKLSASLKDEFPRSWLFPEPELLFPRAFMGYGAAKWATETARDCVIEYSKIGAWQCGVAEMHHRGRISLP